MTKERNGRGGTRTLPATRRRDSSSTLTAGKNKGLRALRSQTFRSVPLERNNVTARQRPIAVEPDPRCEACSFYDAPCLRHYVEALEVEVLALRATRKGGGK